MASIFSFLNFDSSELTCFANAPTLLFSAVFSFYGMIHFGFKGRSFLSVFLSVLATVICLLMIVVMAMTLQRTSLGYFVISACIILFMQFRDHPIKALLFISLVLVLAIPFIQDIYALFDALIIKTQQFGFNKRLQEWDAIWQIVSVSPIHLLFGAGWGAEFVSPAVDGARVNFSHGLLSATLFKLGLVGVILTCLYLYGLFQMWVEIWRRHIPFALALFGPIAINVLLYGGYKSLDFGLILLAVPVILLSGLITPRSQSPIETPASLR